MRDAMVTFRMLCSMIQERTLREQFELWGIRSVNTFQVEARVEESGGRGALEHYQKATLVSLIHGCVEQAAEETHQEWLQGEQKFGTIITRKIKILRSIE